MEGNVSRNFDGFKKTLYFSTNSFPDQKIDGTRVRENYNLVREIIG
jgi:hypothetical protein